MYLGIFGKTFSDNQRIKFVTLIANLDKDQPYMFLFAGPTQGETNKIRLETILQQNCI